MYTLDGQGCLDGSYVLGAWPFGPHSFDVGHALTLAQLVEGNSFDVRHMKKDVVSRLSADEAEAFFSDSFDGSFRHSTNSLK